MRSTASARANPVVPPISLALLLGILMSLQILVVPAQALAADPLPFTGWPLPKPDLLPKQGVRQGRSRPQPNQVRAKALYSASTLAPAQLGVMAGMGFPYLLIQGGVGLSNGSDLRLSVNALYSLMSELALEFRERVYGQDGPLTLALSLRAGYSIYPPQRAALFLSGTRDFGLTPGLVVSTQAKGSATFFAELGLNLAFDLHPQVRALGGAPPPFELVANLPLHGGVELPLAPNIHLVSFVGVDIHLKGAHRDLGEPALLPYLAVALAMIH